MPNKKPTRKKYKYDLTPKERKQVEAALMQGRSRKRDLPMEAWHFDADAYGVWKKGEAPVTNIWTDKTKGGLYSGHIQEVSGDDPRLRGPKAAYGQGSRKVPARPMKGIPRKLKPELAKDAKARREKYKVGGPAQKAAKRKQTSNKVKLKPSIRRNAEKVIQDINKSLRERPKIGVRTGNNNLSKLVRSLNK